MSGPLVIVRCSQCRLELGSLDQMPEDWAGALNVARCRRCVIPTPRRLISVLQGQGATGFALTVDIPLAELRTAALKAQRRGRAVDVTLAPLRQAE